MAVKSKVTTPPFRVSFPSVFEAKSYEGGKPKFSVAMLFRPADFNKKAKAQWKALHDLLDEATLAQFKKKVKDLPDNFRKPLRDGAEKEHLEGYGEGIVFATASSLQRPGLVDRDLNMITDESVFYPGCWARATVTAFTFDNKGKGVAFGLHNLQMLGDDANFTGRMAADEDFEDDAGEVWTDPAAPELEGADPLG